MDSDTFDTMMRSREAYHGLTVLPGAWPVLRVDGRSFSKYTLNAAFAKPFDEQFRDMMLATTQHLLTEVQGLYAYVESDEISIVLPRDTDLFHRSVEKLVSISAAAATSAFTLEARQHVQFDSRIWVGASIEDVVGYFSWRQADAFRCALNGWAYWTLRQDGMSKGKATSVLNGASVSFKNELLFSYGINFNETPEWQRHGVGVHYLVLPKVGHNPITGEDVVVNRRQMFVNMGLPRGQMYRNFIESVLTESLNKGAEV